MDLAEQDANGLVLSNATVVLPRVVHLDDPHDHQGRNATEPTQHEAQLAHVLQRQTLHSVESHQQGCWAQQCRGPGSGAAKRHSGDNDRLGSASYKQLTTLK